MGKGTVLEAKSTQEKRNCPHSLDKYRHFGGERCIKKKKNPTYCERNSRENMNDGSQEQSC